MPSLQRTTRINFGNFYAYHVCFCSIKCYLFKFFWLFFSEYMLHCHPCDMRQLIFLFYGVYKESFPLCQQVCKHYENLLGNTKWCSVNWLRRIFCQCQCHLFYFFLYVSCFGYSFASLCYVVATYIHHHLRTQDKCLRQKDESNAEMCFGVAPLNIR